MPEHSLYLVAGLGNPGREYVHTRHNAGFMAIDALADAFRIPVDKNKFNTLFGRGRIRQSNVILAKPQAYMNRSGPPLRQIADYFRIQREAMIVVHDDIDLAFERLKIKEKGGDGGHKGIRSIIQAFGGGEFTRARLGVGRSEYGADVVDHVLSTFNQEEIHAMDSILQRTCDAVVTILANGTKEAMNRFNRNLR